ncbi:hypothetical protein TUM13189_34620 [Citrobacter koseri]|uniref:DUF6216 family protein n=1 Tax=Citrobacter koseri TaxID=545 RepID=UPI001FCAE5A4|nr:DUF6216 family protein [Citrobacter koseri]BDG85902.1 hypothetical protein TUM13189_34620 [Citrobacter koseri]
MIPSFDSLVPSLSDLLENKISFLIVFLVILISSLLYIKKRSGSGFSIANRFFIFWIGSKDKSESELIDEIIDIEKFNFQYNTRAVSKRQKINFETWIKKYELDFRMISKLKSNFDIEKLKIAKINKIIPTVLFIAMFIPFIIGFETFIIAVKPAGLININDTGWFWFNKNEALQYKFLGSTKNAWVITPESCSNKEKIKIELHKDNDTICESFSSKRSLDYIDKLIAKQRTFFGAVTTFLAITMLVIFKITISLLTTYDARRMVFLRLSDTEKKNMI